MSAGIDLDPVAGLRCADLVDAMGRLSSHPCSLLDLVSPTPQRVLFGPAATVSYLPTRSDLLDPQRHTFAAQLAEAAGDEPTGKVVVLASNGHPDVSMAGGTKLSRLHHLGMAGVLTDGRLRDFDELAGYSFTAYCAGAAVQAGGAVVTPFAAGVPVVLRGVVVFPGDWIFADVSGTVVVPPGHLDRVLHEAHRIVAEDAGFRAEIAQAPDGAGSGSSER